MSNQPLGKHSGNGPEADVLRRPPPDGVGQLGSGPSSTRLDLIRVHDDPTALDGKAWNALLDRQSQPTPFMRWEYLAALHA